MLWIQTIINKDNIEDSVEFKFRVRGPMENKKVVVVVSAQGKTTDNLIAKSSRSEST